MADLRRTLVYSYKLCACTVLVRVLQTADSMCTSNCRNGRPRKGKRKGGSLGTPATAGEAVARAYVERSAAQVVAVGQRAARRVERAVRAAGLRVRVRIREHFRRYDEAREPDAVQLARRLVLQPDGPAVLHSGESQVTGETQSSYGSFSFSHVLFSIPTNVTCKHVERVGCLRCLMELGAI